jgi:CheY-like chemotaxis protein
MATTTRRSKKSGSMKKLLQKEIFTTYDAARICQANIASIKNWILKGYLKAFRTPGGHFRIERHNLISFLDRYGMPNPFTAGIKRTVFFLSTDDDTTKKLEGRFEEYEFIPQTTYLTALREFGKVRPDLVLMDMDALPGEPESFIDTIAADPDLGKVKIVAYSESPESIDGERFTAVVEKSFRYKGLLDTVEDLVS